MSVAKSLLSGSTDGQLIKVAATSTPGTTIHTADASNIEEIHLFAYNSHTADVKLTVEWGGTTSPDDLLEYTIPFKDGLIIAIPGFALTNSLVVKAFASVTNVVYIAGFTNDIGATAQTVSKEIFSGSTDGRPVKPTATSTPGTTIHTAHSSELDEIWAWAMNYNAANEAITIEWGSTGADHQILQTIIGENGGQLIIPGLPLTNSGTLKIFSGTAAVNIFGYVNRYTA